jgi:hypothetical protein
MTAHRHRCITNHPPLTMCHLIGHPHDAFIVLYLYDLMVMTTVIVGVIGMPTPVR